MTEPKYQLFGRLRPEEYGALEADIKKRGVQVPIEVDENGDTLDGHHRREIADRLGKSYEITVRKGMSEAEKRDHIIKLNIARRQLDPVRWGQAFRMLCEGRGADFGRGSNQRRSATVAECAAELGVPVRTARHRVAQAKVYETLPTEKQAAIDQGKLTLQDAKRQVKWETREQLREEASVECPEGEGIITGDMETLFDYLDDDSVGMFYTDPPYVEDSVQVFGRLAKLGSLKLRPGGFCLAYSGHMFLPTILAEMTQHLEYFWQFAIRNTEGFVRIWNRHVYVGWRSVLVMAKPPIRPATPWVMDFVEGGGRDKRFHEWGQDASEAMYWIDKLTEPGDLVVDPFCGGGTIPVACLATKRRWIATEIDPGNAAVARKRIRECADKVEAA